MLLPRPEIRTATRFGSRIVGRGPPLAGDRAAAPAFVDSPDFDRKFTSFFQRAVDVARTFGRHDVDHANSAIERARHFLRSDPASRLQHGEDRWELPRANIYGRVAIIGQNPRNILEKSATSD